MNHDTGNNSDAFVPGFRHDVFVSYSHADDHDGWVTEFSLKLQRLVNAELGHKSEKNIFFDRPSVDPSAPLAKTLEDAVQNSATLVVVLSNAYVKSDWCRRERELFFQNAGGSAGAQGRVFVIRYSALGYDLAEGAQVAARPVELRDYLGMQFYTVDRERNVPETYTPDEKPFLKELNCLRFHIAKQLSKLTKQKPAQDDAHQAREPDTIEPLVVYLAEPTFELFHDYASLDTNLSQDKVTPIRVVPGRQQFSHAPSGYEEQVTGYLDECDLFVQLLGSAEFPKNDAFSDGYDRWLLELAQQRGKPTLRWRDPTVDLASIASAERAAFLDGPDVISRGMAEFQGLLAKQCGQLFDERRNQRLLEETRRDVSGARPAAGKFVLLKAHRHDLSAAMQLGSQLSQCSQGQIGFDVVNGEIGLAAAASTTSYDGVVLFCQELHPSWLSQEQRQVRNIFVRRPESMPRQWIIYVASSSDDNLLPTRLPGVHLVQGDGTAGVESLVALIHGAEGAA